MSKLFKNIIPWILVCPLYTSTNYLISDLEFTNQNFTLKKTKTFIKSFPNNRLTVRQIRHIYYQSKYYEINILISLAKLEAESGLVSNPLPGYYKFREHRCMGYGMYLNKWIDGAKHVGKKVYKYGGFDCQIREGIRCLRKHFDRYKPDKVVLLKCINKKVNPDNAATYSLFLYTPFYYNHDNYGKIQAGNMGFVKIFRNFQKRWIGQDNTNLPDPE